MGAAQNMKVELDREALRAIKNLTSSIEKNNDLRQRELREARRPIVTNVHNGRPCPHEHLKGGLETLVKVEKALEDAYSGPDDPATVAKILILAMQAQGILFREVNDSEDSGASQDEL